MTAKYDQTQMKQRLLGVIKDRNLSMREVALGSGNSESYLSGMLKTDRDPQISRLVRVCDYLGLSLTWVLYGFELPEGSEEILQLIAERPDAAASIAALLRAQSESDVQ